MLNAIIEIFFYLPELFYASGAFVCWAFKGFSTSFEKEMDEHFFRNVIAAVLLWGTVGVLLFLILGK